MTEYQTLVTRNPDIIKLLTSEDFRTAAIGSAAIISVRTNMMGSMTTYTKAQLDNHACYIAPDSNTSSVTTVNYQITYGSNYTAQCTMIILPVPMFSNLAPDEANALNAGYLYPYEVTQALTVAEIPTGGTLLYNDSPVSVGDTVYLNSNLTFEPDDYMGNTDYDQSDNPIPRRLGLTITYHDSTYDIAGQTITVPLYPQKFVEMYSNYTNYHYSNYYYGLQVSYMVPWSGSSGAYIGVTIDELPSNAGTLYIGNNSSRYPAQAGDYIPYSTSMSWKSALPPTADYTQDLKYHYEDTIVNGELIEPAGVGVGHFRVIVNGPSLYTHTFSFPERQSDGTAWPYGTEVGALDYAALQPVTASITSSGGTPFAASGNVIVVNNGSQLDYETKPTWIVKARVTDKYGQYREANQTINLTDVAEAPVISHIANEYIVEESSVAGTYFGSFEIKAESSSHNITTTISGSLGNSILGRLGYDLSDLFYCSNGQYPRFYVKNQGLLDYERLVHDGSCTFTATITVHDNTNGTSTSATTHFTVKNVVEPTVDGCLITVNGKLLQPTNYTGFVLKVNR